MKHPPARTTGYPYTTLYRSGGGTCAGTDTSASDCNDNNVCTTDGCVAETGCTHTNNTGSCNDGNACTTGDVCGGGTCAGTDTSASDCNDNSVCTTDGCVAATGCTHTNNTGSCNDGNACTTGDVCGGGTSGRANPLASGY